MATPGLMFRIGGTLDPTFKTALASSVEQAKVAGVAVQNSLRTQVGLLEKAASGMTPGSVGQLAAAKRLSEAKLALQATEDVKMLAMKRAAGVQLSLAEALRLKEAGLEYRSLGTVAAEVEAEKIAANKAAMAKIVQQEHEAAMAEDAIQMERIAAAEKVAATKSMLNAITLKEIEAENLALLEQVAIGNGAAARSVGGAHGAGGMTGIIRESLVIMREISMGRGSGRIGGSITLLAQYLGILKYAVKSTATESLLASVAATKLSQAMAVQALQARGTAAYNELLAASQVQEATAAKAATEANIALASATVTLNPIFFAVVGTIVAAGAAAFFLWRHYERLAKQAKNLADALNPLKQKYTELAEAQDKAAKSAQEYLDWKNDLLALHTSESDAIERKIKLLHEEARARGLSETETLAAEKELLTVEKARLDNQLKRALAASDAAAAAATAGASLTDDKGRKITLEEAQHQAKRLGEILDAAEENRDNTITHNVVGMKPGMYGGQDPIFATQPASDSDLLTFKVNGKEFSMTVDQARENFEKASNQARILEADQKALDDVLKDSKSSAAQIQAARNKVAGDLDDINDEQKFPEKARRGGGDFLGLTDRQRAGAQIGGPEMALLDVNKQQLVVLHRIDKNTQHHGSKSSPWGGYK